MKKLIEIRKIIKNKKPVFIRQDAHKKSRVSLKWRKSKGLHSKMRLVKKGYNRSVSTGWKSPAMVKEFHASGLKPIPVSNVGDLSNIKENQGALISGTVGKRKRVEILTKAKELKITVLNVDDIDNYLKEVKEKLEEKKKSKKQKDDKKKDKQKVKKAKSEKEEEISDEDKKKKEKAVKDKILTKKQ